MKNFNNIINYYIRGVNMLLSTFAVKYGEKKFHKKTNCLTINLSKGLFYIRSGAVKLLYGHTKDQVIAVDIYKEGEFFGYVDHLCFTGISHMKIVFLEDTDLIFLNNETLFYHSSMDNKLRVNIFKTIGKLLQDSIERLVILSVFKKREIIMHILYNLAAKFGSVLNNGKIMLSIKLNDTDIKELCNTSRENVNRTLATLIHDGILERKKGYLIFSSKEDLDRLILYSDFGKSFIYE
jgi:CRP/FNR family transcriptional regulator, polysaccharide utilization system transcription regulator